MPPSVRNMDQKFTQAPSHRVRERDRSSTLRTAPSDQTNNKHNRSGLQGGGDVESDAAFKREGRDAPGQSCLYITPGMHNEEHYKPAKVADMAAAGFYYSGFKDRVKCFSCGISVENWTIGDDVMDKKWHKFDCRLVAGADAYNKPLLTPCFRTSRREYKGLTNFTLTGNNNSGQKNHQAMTALLSVIRTANNAICAEASTPMENVTSNMANFQLSEMNYQCNRITNLSSGNIPMTDSQRRVATEADRTRITALRSAGTNGEPPNPSIEEQRQQAVKSPCSCPTNQHMESLEARIASFDSRWPGSVRASKEHLAGESDRHDKCFYWKGTEHAKWFSGCDYVKNLKEAHPNLSRPYIRNSVSYDVPPTAEVQRAPMSHANENTTSSRININQIMSMGFSREQIDNAIQRKKGEYRTTEELLNNLLEHNAETPSPPHGLSSIFGGTVQSQPMAAIVGSKRKVGKEGATSNNKMTKISFPAESFSTECQSNKVLKSKWEPWTGQAERCPRRANKSECSTTGMYCDLGDQPNKATPWQAVSSDGSNSTNTFTADTFQQLEILYPRFLFANVLSLEHRSLLRRLNLQSEADRRKTFVKWPSHFAWNLPGQLSKNGFFYLGNSDRIQCFSCRGTLSNWPLDECAYWTPQQHLPKCKFVEDLDSGNISMTDNQRQTAQSAENCEMIEVLRKRESEQLCIICKINKASVVLSPCRHQCVCSGCSGRERCPICRTDVQSIMPAILAPPMVL